MAPSDYYKILQVDPEAEGEVIAAAYRRLAKMYHPDVNPGATAQTRMREINNAYAVLSDSAKRAEYDQQRESNSSAAQDADPQTDWRGPSYQSTEDSMEPRGIGFWLRWLAVAPAAILSVVIASFPLHWAVLLITGSNDSDDGSLGLADIPPETLERLGQAFLTPFAFISVGAWMAPAFQVHTGVVLTVLYALGLGAALAVGASNGAYSGREWIELLAIGVLGVAGALSALYGVNERHGDLAHG